MQKHSAVSNTYTFSPSKVENMQNVRIGLPTYLPCGLGVVVVVVVVVVALGHEQWS